MMKHTQSEIEDAARQLFDGNSGSGVSHNYITGKDVKWTDLTPKMKQSWKRGAMYYMRKQDVENAVDNAVENEAMTKGWPMAHQGAWDMAGFYAEEAGVSIDAFRKNMLKRHRGQFTKETK
jgi:hypothetical protein